MRVEPVAEHWTGVELMAEVPAALDGQPAAKARILEQALVLVQVAVAVLEVYLV
jgi:hypothetical protein